MHNTRSLMPPPMSTATLTILVSSRRDRLRFPLKKKEFFLFFFQSKIRVKRFEDSRIKTFRLSLCPCFFRRRSPCPSRYQRRKEVRIIVIHTCICMDEKRLLTSSLCVCIRIRFGCELRHSQRRTETHCRFIGSERPSAPLRALAGARNER